MPKVRADGGIQLQTAFIIDAGEKVCLKPWKVLHRNEIPAIAFRMGSIARNAKVSELVVIATAIADDPELQYAVHYEYVNLLDARTQSFVRPYTLVGDSIIFDTNEPIMLQVRAKARLADYILDGYMEGAE